jgi:hypothetical protein
MLHIVGLRKGIRFVSSTAIFCEIRFVKVDFAHWTVAQRPEIIKIKKLATYDIRFCVLDMKSF